MASLRSSKKIECLYCGEKCHNSHTPEELADLQEHEEWVKKREAEELAKTTAYRARVQAAGRAKRMRKINELKRQLEYWENPTDCKFCIDLPRGAETLKSMEAEMLGLTIIQHDMYESSAYCPECGNCLAAWE